MNALRSSRLHCISLSHLHSLTANRGWELWSTPASAHPLLRSPRGALFQLILAAQTRTPSKPCTFLAERYEPSQRFSDS